MGRLGIRQRYVVRDTMLDELGDYVFWMKNAVDQIEFFSLLPLGPCELSSRIGAVGCCRYLNDLRPV